MLYEKVRQLTHENIQKEGKNKKGDDLSDHLPFFRS